MKLVGTIQDRLNLQIGVKYGRLTILGFIEPQINKAGAMVHIAKCQCACGKIKEIKLHTLKSGNVQSCGCLLIEHLNEKCHKHKLSRIPGGLYRLLRTMKSRCYYVDDDHYPFYGAKGVTICDEWLNDFISFYNWCMENGYKRGLQIDKDIKAKELGVEPNLYSPERCMFVTSKENCRNKSNNKLIEHEGKILCISEWADITGIHKTTIWYRWKRGLPPAEIFSYVGVKNINASKTIDYHLI